MRKWELLWKCKQIMRNKHGKTFLYILKVFNDFSDGSFLQKENLLRGLGNNDITCFNFLEENKMKEI